MLASKVMGLAKAIKRLYELKGIDRDKGGDRKSTDTGSVGEISRETGLEKKQVQRLRTIADLIPDLAKLARGLQRSQIVTATSDEESLIWFQPGTYSAPPIG